jgi:TatD DNase family protein
MGLERILVPGIDLKSSQAALRLAEEHPKVFAAVGVHPNSALSWNDSAKDALLKMTQHSKVAAVGEIGLDYYRDHAPQNNQKKILQEQLSLADDVKFPVILHVRNKSTQDRRCISDLIDMLGERKPATKHPGVVHSYSGNEAEANRLMALGYFIGFTGPITYKNADVMRAVLKEIPLNRLLIETDAPFLSPQPKRGKRNEPAYVRFIAEKISEVHQCRIEMVIEQTSVNAQLLFGWKEEKFA